MVKNKILSILVHLSYRCQNILLSLLQGILFKPFIKETTKKILIYRIGSIGDNVCALPAIHSIVENFPDAKIDILTNAGDFKYGRIDKLVDHSLVNRFLFFETNYKWKLLKEIRSTSYDLFIELPRVRETIKVALRNMVFAKLSGTRSAFGWQIFSNTFLKKHQGKYHQFDREAIRLLKMLNNNGVVGYDEKYGLERSIDDERKTSEILKKNNLEDKSKNVAIVLGAKYNKKRWPITNFEEVMKFLLNEGYHVLLIGGDTDKVLINKINIEDSRIYNFVGKLSITQSVYMLKACHFAITNDTGPMHLSYAVNTPVLALFSASDYPGIWYPPEKENNIILRGADVMCSPCFTSVCHDNICMKAITVKHVIVNIEKMMKLPVSY